MKFTITIITLIHEFLTNFCFADLSELGKAEYQLLQERVNLPHYGSCWKQALEHVNTGCNTLSEQTQSEIALHLTNCFLSMSGHETYTCEDDKKPNLRGICISSMSDRAFNVYTEFYTHTQNICWFLKGQIWHEIIAENTYRAGQQLEMSMKNQEMLLESQKESIKLQEKLLSQGLILERIVEEIVGSRETMAGLQNWLLGEMSWVNTIGFHLISFTLIFLVTSVKRTENLRLTLLVVNILFAYLERKIFTNLPQFFSNNSAADVQAKSLFYVWLLRYLFLALIILSLIYSTVTYKDFNILNSTLIDRIYKQNLEILKFLKKKSTSTPCQSPVVSYDEISEKNWSKISDDHNIVSNVTLNLKENGIQKINNNDTSLLHIDRTHKNNIVKNRTEFLTPKNTFQKSNDSNFSVNCRYYLRNKTVR